MSERESLLNSPENITLQKEAYQLYRLSVEKKEKWNDYVVGQKRNRFLKLCKEQGKDEFEAIERATSIDTTEKDFALTIAEQEGFAFWLSLHLRKDEKDVSLEQCREIAKALTQAEATEIANITIVKFLTEKDNKRKKAK